MGPVWDFDRNSIGENYGSLPQIIDDNNIWFKKLIKNDLFINAVKECWQDNKGNFKTAFNDALTMSKTIDIAAKMDMLRWNRIFYDSTVIELWFEKRFESFDEYIKSL